MPIQASARLRRWDVNDTVLLSGPLSVENKAMRRQRVGRRRGNEARVFLSDG